MPKQAQAQSQQQTVIVKVTAPPEKKRRKRRAKKRVPPPPTAQDILSMARPAVTYTPLGPDTGSQFRELLTAISMLKTKKDTAGSFTPAYADRPDIVDVVRDPQERPIPEPEPIVVSDVATETEPVPKQAVATETEPVPEMTKGDFDTIVKYMKKIDSSTTNKTYKDKWKSFDQEEKMMFRISIQNSRLTKEKQNKILNHLGM